jgi:hypothetical protein
MAIFDVAGKKRIIEELTQQMSSRISGTTKAAARALIEKKNALEPSRGVTKSSWRTRKNWNSWRTS